MLDEKEKKQKFMNDIDTDMHNIYGWTVKDGRACPPEWKFPKFVVERLKWVLTELNSDTGLSLSGAVKFMLEISDEKSLKEDWERHASSPYLAVNDDYKKWIDLGLHQASVVVALIYGGDWFF